MCEASAKVGQTENVTVIDHDFSEFDDMGYDSHWSFGCGSDYSSVESGYSCACSCFGNVLKALYQWYWREMCSHSL